MIRRPEGLDLRRSLRSALGDGHPGAVEAYASRQERTVDAILQRLYDDQEERRREFVLLADEVGLGKTYVALGVAWSVLHQRRAGGLAKGPVLVVTPHAHALFSKWRREAERFQKEVVPEGMGFDVSSASTPHGLARALRARRPTLVIARMSAFSGRLHRYDTARMAAIHSLLRMNGFELSMRERIRLMADWPADANRFDLDLRRSTTIWDAARETPEVGFGDAQVRAAWRRLEAIDPGVTERLRQSWARVRGGRGVRSDFPNDLRELCRAALGQSVRHGLPLVIVDEIHNWKNHPQSWQRFLHSQGQRIERLLGLSATPFQLGPHELIQVLDLRRCINLATDRTTYLRTCAAELDTDLRAAGVAGKGLRTAWADVGPSDLADIEKAWANEQHRGTSDGLPPRLRRAAEAAEGVRHAHAKLGRSLRPFLIRHRRDVSHRSWWVGAESTPDTVAQSARGAALRWRPGLDVRGDAELVHYLMMRAVQEQKEWRGSTSLGADLGGSYAFFREHRLQRIMPGRTPAAGRYLALVEQAVSGASHEHPKVAVTADRAFRAWLRGDKTLVFCFNVKTVDAIRTAVNHRIDEHNTNVLTAALDCTRDELEARLRNLQSRLYYYRQSVFLLFQDHPLAGPRGRLPRELALTTRGVDELAARLALGGPPRDRSLFDRRRVLAAAEQTLVTRWQKSAAGQVWLEKRLDELKIAETTTASIDIISASDWPARRREHIEGVLREAELEELPDEEAMLTARSHADSSDIDAWVDVLTGRAGQAVLAPYLADPTAEVPSLLTRWHAAELARLPFRLRALANRMLRRMVRSPGFLARFILDDPTSRPSGEDEAAGEDWTTLIHRRYDAPPSEGESARERFSAYLETLRKAVGLEELSDVYEEASKNRDVVTRVTGSVASSERDRIFMGFNTPLFPEVLIVTTVGQEGIDLHRECRHVIHHDLPWNPATLEQRTGRVDRIGSKTERLQRNADNACALDVAVPYIAGTYDEHRFRIVHGRAHIFEVTMGGEYTVDGHRVVIDDIDAEDVESDLTKHRTTWTPIPEVIAKDLRLRLEGVTGTEVVRNQEDGNTVAGLGDQ